MPSERHNIEQVDADLRRVADAADALVRTAQDLRNAIDGLSDSVRAAVREAGEVSAVAAVPAVAPPTPAAPAHVPQPIVAEAAADVPEGARIVALNMVLDGKPRDEVAAQLQDEFGLTDTDALLDDVFSRAG